MNDFLKKHKTVIITVVIVLVLLMLAYVFKDDIKALFSKSEPVEDLNKPNNSNDTTTATNNSTNTTQSPIGKSAYANQNNVAILYKVDASTIKTKNKDEFVGVINGSTKIGGADWYTLGNGALVVAKNKVYIK